MEQKKADDRYALAQQQLKNEREERDKEREERAEVRKHEREMLMFQLQLANAGDKGLPDSRR